MREEGWKDIREGRKRARKAGRKDIKEGRREGSKEGKQGSKEGRKEGRKEGFQGRKEGFQERTTSKIWEDRAGSENVPVTTCRAQIWVLTTERGWQ